MNTKKMKWMVYAGLAVGMAATAAHADCRGGYLWARGGSTVRITAGDGIPDPIQIYPRHVQAENFTFVITDSESTVLAYSTDNIFDLEGAGEGTCRVYGVAYSGEFSMPTGVPVHSLTASECLSLSRNNITIIRSGVETVDGGWIIGDGRGRSKVKICLQDPYPVRAYSANNASPDSNYAYVITDVDGIVLAYPPSNQFDFSGAPAGICRIYGVSFTGELDETTGIAIYDVMSSEELDLSKNYIRVVRRERCKHH